MNNDFNNPFAQHSETTSYIQENNQESDNEDIFLGESRNVSAINCIKWIIDGWRLLREQPLMWLLATFLFLAIGTSISTIFTFADIATSTPVFIIILFAIISIINPIFMAGFMFACHKQHDTSHFDIANIFSGFTKKLPQLIIIGILQLILFTVIGLFLHTILSELSRIIIIAFTSGGALFQSQMQLIPIEWKTLVISFILGIVCFAAIYLAPALIIINNMSVIDALKHSLIAFVKNFFGAILLILLVFTIFFIIQHLMMLIILHFGVSLIFSHMVLLKVFIILFDFFICSIYISVKYAIYRDIFYK